MEFLLILITWDEMATSVEDQMIPVQDTMVDIFMSHKATKDRFVTYSDIVPIGGNKNGHYRSRCFDQNKLAIVNKK